MAKGWNLPEDLVESIACHHSPSSAQNHAQLASVIHVANGLASMLGIGGGVDSFLNPIQEDALSCLALQEADLERIIADLGEILLDPTIFA